MNKRIVTSRKSKLLAILLTLVICTSAISFTAMATITTPTTIGAPEHFAAAHYNGDYFYYTASAPDDIRALMDSIAADENKTKTAMFHKLQIDYKLDNGDWHYTSNWDVDKNLRNFIGMTFIHNQSYISHERASLSYMFPDDTATLKPIKDTGLDYFKSHSISFRVRFITTFDGGSTRIYSNWSDTYVYSSSIKSDPDKLMSHAPTLTSATVEKNSGGSPYLNVKTGRLPGETQDLNAMTGGAVWTEIWMRKAGDKDFKMINNSFFKSEYILINANDYFDKALQSYDAESYEIKIRYKVDLRSYKQSGRSDIIYSPFSNIFSQNMPAWSGASNWATAELQKASDMGLIPDILKGQDMTKNITREEFAEVSLLMYEKASGITNTTPATPNPFTDTTNSQILKAFKLGIVKGVSTTEFAPKNLINREQVAAMLTRTIKLIAPDADYTTAGAPTFTDMSDISGWALNDCLYMGKIGIIKGSDGKFMPKAISDAQKAVGYANTSREQALAMSVRTVNKIDEIK